MGSPWCYQFRLDARGVLAHSWFRTHLGAAVIAEDMGDRIVGYNTKFRRTLKASIYGSLFITSLRSVSARSQTRCVCEDKAVVGSALRGPALSSTRAHVTGSPCHPHAPSPFGWLCHQICGIL